MRERVPQVRPSPAARLAALTRHPDARRELARAAVTTGTFFAHTYVACMPTPAGLHRPATGMTLHASHMQPFAFPHISL